ncbi:UDPglucose--hexose-1-phosphate uridylyltransferase [Ruminococcaceae bacterium YRB3002]|nr:UDPglucose--hexose-1-phosphate uridylyltransferase [Ruminococcaceae bacterium YRB3002]
MINTYITELVNYAVSRGLISEDDRIYSVNRLLELFGLIEYAEPSSDLPSRALSEILDDMTDYAFKNGLIESDSVANRDLFDTKIMGLVTPAPSVVRKTFEALYEVSPEDATEWYYKFSQDTNYIRTDRIARDEKWTAETEYGTLDITINLSKPEKDPRDIAAAGKAKKSGYPACLLCCENEGYSGTLTHPARQNHRIIPITLAGEEYFLQYSPYVYYNEHCIILNRKHTPMVIDRAVFAKILDFVEQFPHYIAGSNADLPIVGGSILSHDHFQGGGYEFPMARAPIEKILSFDGFSDVSAGIVRWPLSVIRLNSSDKSQIIELADRILTTWRSYTDEDAFILAYTDGVPHNTITPIARMRDGNYELDLVLRNNITTEECPLGYYHPHSQYHHIKKENIGLIEVMGLAVLPARLKGELASLAEAILEGRDLRADEVLAKHADWADEWRATVYASNIDNVIKEQVAIVFSHVLEDAGVYKCSVSGREAFMRFVEKI